MKALILGGSSDLGLEIAKLLLAKGYQLILTERKAGSLKPILEADPDLNSQTVSIIGFDAQNEASWKDLIEKTPKDLDLLFCVSGYLPEPNPEDPEIFKTLDANYRGLVPVLLGFHNQMVKNGRGSIVGVSSVAGERGRGSNFLYGSAKAGFTAFMDGLRHFSQGTGVQVITIIPGYMRTKMLRDKTPEFLTYSPEKAAKLIFRAVQRKRNRVFIGPIWFWVMAIIRNIPEGIFLKSKL